jgi:hypothetical protein
LFFSLASNHLDGTLLLENTNNDPTTETSNITNSHQVSLIEIEAMAKHEVRALSGNIQDVAGVPVEQHEGKMNRYPC